MTEANSSVEAVKQSADEALERVATHPWMERLARFGYAAKGVVYMVVGALATMAALGVGGQVTDTRGALHAIAMQPFGKILLSVVAGGLVGYVIWRWIQAIADADGKGRDLKGLSIRTGYWFSGAVYAGLSFTAVQIILEAQHAQGGNAPEDWTARLLSLPYGAWLVELAGACVFGFGVYQIYKGYTAKFRKRLKLGQMSTAKKAWATLSGRVGYAARGVVFCIVGFLLVQAARHYNPSEAGGLDDVLQTLARQSYGPWILGIVAAGLFIYGFYMLVEARYRVIAGS